VEKVEVKEAGSRELHSMIVIEIKAEDRVTKQVKKLGEAIQQLQQNIAELELRAMPKTP
jgi:hypothetical protein